MKIKTISVTNDGYVNCKSVFYSSQDILNNSNYDFVVGINKLMGEIDSGVWAVSYMLSMYEQCPKDFVLLKQPEITVNNTVVSLSESMEYSCYLDKTYSLFKSKQSVRNLVSKGIRTTNMKISPDSIRDMFHINSERFERPLTGVGNEIFRAMAAIAHVHGKQVFCFPWLSKKRFQGYHEHITDLLNILEQLEKVVILPIGE